MARLAFAVWVLGLQIACTGVTESHAGKEAGGTTATEGATNGAASGGQAAPADAGAWDAGGMDAGGTGAWADASSGSSGSTDAGAPPSPGFSTDRSEFFGAARCANADFLLCEDFEAQDAPSPARWQQLVSNNGTQLRVDSLQAARGSRALHLTVASGFSQAFIRETQTFPAAAQGFWGRAFFYMKSPLPTTFNHWTVAEATGIENGSTTVQVRYGGILNPGVKAHHFLFNFEKQPRPAGFDELGMDDRDVLSGRARQIAPDVWHCVEWRYDVAKSEASFFWDGVERPALHPVGMVGATAMKFPAFNGLNIGWTLYQSLDRPYEVWIDEVAIDKARVGCQR